MNNSNELVQVHAFAASTAEQVLHEKLISELQAAGHKVLRPLLKKDSFAGGDLTGTASSRVLMILDFEATGKDPAKDTPVEIGFVRVQYDFETGALGRVIERFSGFEDPGVELSADVQRITNLNRSMLLGHVFDDEHIGKSIQASDFVIAHNASYDRVMGERRFPELAGKPWGCTLREGPWEAMGINTRSQEFLAFKVAGIHYDAHRALTDCEALLEIMASAAHDGRTCFSHVLQTSREPTYTVWAQGATFDKKDILKNDGGYRWSAEDEGKVPKTWYKEGVLLLAEEFRFLKENVYGYDAGVVVDSVNAMQRHSRRCDNRQRLKLSQVEPDLTGAPQSKPSELSSAAAPTPRITSADKIFSPESSQAPSTIASSAVSITADPPDTATSRGAGFTGVKFRSR